MPDFIVSNSEIQLYKTCRRKWYLRHIRGLRAPEKATGALQLGTNVHEALGSYYSPGGSAVGSLLLLEQIYSNQIEKFPFDEEAVQKEYRLAHAMTEGYFQWAEEEGIDSNFTFVESEAEIESDFTLPSGLVVRVLGKRDLIGQDEHDRRFFLDFKTCQTLGDSLLDINEQLYMYALLHKLNNPEEMPQYAVWRMLRKVQRSVKAKPPFYKSEQIELSDRALRHFYLRLQGTLEDMARTRQQLADGVDHRIACYPTASQDCSWKCEFRVACPMVDKDPHHEEFLQDKFEQHDPYSRYENKGSIE